MERKERELLATKLVKKMESTFNKGSKVLSELSVGDKVRVQNCAMLRMTCWDKTGMIMKMLWDRQYEILMDGSRCISVSNRRHLRKV